MRDAFAEVICLPEVHDGNIVALGFRSAPTLDYPALYARAARIRESSGLRARSWVNGIKH
jgi:hypothetical protein